MNVLKKIRRPEKSYSKTEFDDWNHATGQCLNLDHSLSIEGLLLIARAFLKIEVKFLMSYKPTT